MKQDVEEQERSLGLGGAVEHFAGMIRGREVEHRGDIFQSIINSAPVPVIWMSESVNEVDGMRRSDRGEEGWGRKWRRRGGRRKKASRRKKKKEV